MTGWKRVVIVGLGMLCFAVGSAAAPDKEPGGNAAGDAKPVVILDAHSVAHVFPVMQPPLIQSGNDAKPFTSNYEWLDSETPAPPANWTSPDFSDAAWLRGNARSGPHSPYVANLDLRTKFNVTDPLQVKDLKLTVAYYGGIIVYVNGKELTRANLPKDPAAPLVADGYPDAAYVSDKGEIIPGGWVTERYPAALAARERKLNDFSIPASALREGVNVLAIEAVRAPYNKIVDISQTPNFKQESKDHNCPYNLSWATCDIRSVKLAAPTAAGLMQNAVRSKELQAWNSDLLAADFSTDLADNAEPLRPVDIKGPRNGWSSGKVVIGAPKAIDGLKVTCGDLKQGAATIPASQMRVRYAVAPADKTRDDAPLDSLLETALPSFPSGTGGACVVPIWFTVKVPADAKAGIYSGQATVEAAGEKTLTVPIRLEVAGYTVPDTQNYRTWMELMQSPDTLAMEYNTPLWSDKHWQLLNESMRYIGEIGSRVVYIPLIAQTNMGNEQSMVRWIKKSDGTWDYDFSIMDKYLDMAEKTMGTPKLVVFVSWEIYLDTPKSEVKVTDKDKEDAYKAMEKSWLEARWNLRGKGPAVTAIDPVTKEISTINLPRFEDPAAKIAWKPLFDELHKRMAQRGLEKTMLLGMASDQWASKEEMTVLEDVSGGLPWINHTHGGNHVGKKLDDIADVAYTAYVWNNRYATDISKGRTYGWKRPELYVEFLRFTMLNDWPLTSMLLFPEIQITGQQRGLGRIGADFWPVIKNKREQRSGWVWDKYPQSKWHSCNLMSHMLDPGPTGPVASARYEVLREGVQESEARISIEMVLTDDALKAKLGPELSARAQQLLDERVEQELKAWSCLQLTGITYSTATNPWYEGSGGLAGHEWYASSGWQSRTQKLYDLAAEVSAKLAAK